MSHQHDSTYPAPATKDELVKHLIEGHGSKWIDANRWTVPELKHRHRNEHTTTVVAR